MLAMGDAYAEGKGIAWDAKQAVEWYRKAAEVGNVEAMLALGRVYGNQKYGLQDKAEAVCWLRKAADKGNDGAMFALGRAYEHGDGVERSIREAIKWYRRLAEKNTSAPSLRVGGYPFTPLLSGIIPGIPCSIWPIGETTRRTGIATAYDMAQRGYAYEQGIAGVEKDMKKAVEWFQKAAEAGDGYSMLALGNAYANGDGIAQNEEKAMEWYRRAAEVSLRYRQNGRGEL